MNITQLINQHPSFTEVAAIQDFCQPLTALNIAYFSHAHIDSNGRFSFISSCPHFTEVYLKKGYYDYDLHKLSVDKDEQCIVWDNVERKQQSKAMHEDFMGFGRAHTFSIIRSNGKTRDLFHFAAPLGHDVMNSRYLSHLDLLHSFILHFKDKVAKSKQINEAYNFKLRLSKQHGGFLMQNACQIDSEIQSAFEQQLKLERIYFNGNEKYLTCREFQCLHWQAMGKTADEIAAILKITPRTVKAHVVNLKEKLSCHTQFQLGMAYAELRQRLSNHLITELD